MVEQFIFITISIILFGIIFFKMIKRNDTTYVILLLIEAIGFALDCISMVFSIKLNSLFKIMTYLMCIVLPLALIILEYKNIDIINIIKFAQVNFYMYIGNYKKAKDILIYIIDKNHNSYSAHKKLATIYEKEGGIRKCIDEYVRCIEIDKKDYDSYYKVAIHLNELDKKDEAIQMLNNLLNKKPDYTDASIVLGDLLIEKEEFKEAVTVYNEAIKYKPESYELNYSLGIVYTMLNDFQNAKEYYDKCVQINTLLHNPKYSLAQISMLYKELEMATQYFEECLEDEELQADSYYELAKICLMQGNKDRAIKYANIAIDIDSKKISEKIKKEPLFMMILSKISIPFNLEEKEENEKMSKKEKMAKEHLENMSSKTINMGYVELKENTNEEEKKEKETNNSIDQKEKE